MDDVVAHLLVRRGPVQDSNLGPIVSIVAWILIACAFLAVSVKLFLWAIATRRFLYEDAGIIISLALSIGYTAAVTWASEHGLGQYDATVTPAASASVQRALYVSDILLVPTLASTQLSILLFLLQITPYQRHKISLYISGVLVGLLAVPALLVACFQCAGPAFTQILQRRCIDQEGFWTAYGAVSIVLEVAFVALPAWIVSAVQIPTSRKLTIIACFACRLAVVGAWIAALAERRTLDKGANYLHDSWKYYLCLVVVQASAVITQCIPYIRNLLVGVESGMIRTGRIRLRASSRSAKGSGAAGGNSGSNASSGRKASAGWIGGGGSGGMELQGLGGRRQASESRGPLNRETDPLRGGDDEV